MICWCFYPSEWTYLHISVQFLSWLMMILCTFVNPEGGAMLVFPRDITTQDSTFLVTRAHYSCREKNQDSISYGCSLQPEALSWASHSLTPIVAASGIESSLTQKCFRFWVWEEYIFIFIFAIKSLKQKYETAFSLFFVVLCILEQISPKSFCLWISMPACFLHSAPCSSWVARQN